MQTLGVSDNRNANGEDSSRDEDNVKYGRREVDQLQNRIAAVAKLVATVGVPALIALYLTWTYTTSIASSLVDIRDIDRAHEISSAIARTRLDTHMEQSINDAQRIQLLLRQICMNTSKTEEARLQCFR